MTMKQEDIQAIVDEVVRRLLADPVPPTHLFATYRSPASAVELLELAATTPSLHPVQDYEQQVGAVGSSLAKLGADPAASAGEMEARLQQRWPSVTGCHPWSPASGSSWIGWAAGWACS